MDNTWDNPVLSTMEQKINVMMGNSGFAPDWVMLDKEIRVTVVELKEDILETWNRCGPHPMSHSNSEEWEQNLLAFQAKVEYINSKIKHRNLIGPVVGQKVHMKLEKLILQVTLGVIPVREQEKGRTDIGEDTQDTDSSTFIGLTGFIIAFFGFLGLNR